jgi:hypothetical protein
MAEPVGLPLRCSRLLDPSRASTKERGVFSGYNDRQHVMILLYSIATAFAFWDRVVIQVALDISVRAPQWIPAHVLHWLKRDLDDAISNDSNEDRVERGNMWSCYGLARDLENLDELNPLADIF